VKGFSLIELMISLSLSLAIGLAAIQLFQTHERSYGDQNAVAETKQNARATAAQIADEIRRAGTGVPSFAASAAGPIDEAIAVVLNGSDSTHLRLRTGASNVLTSVLTVPAQYALNTPRSISVADASTFATALGTTTPSGRFVYLWGSGNYHCLGWIRAELLTVDSATKTLSIAGRQAAGCLDTVPGVVSLVERHTVMLEEAVSFFLNSGSIWRATATDMTNQTNPLWGPSSELLRNVTKLSFAYYDASGTAVDTATFSGRAAVSRIDTVIEVRPAGARPTVAAFTLQTHGYPRLPRTP
jgi:prepilin-type N-terminal cleavage/methylation domain-containing protein